MVALDEHFQHNGTTTRSGGGSIATPITLPNTDQSRNYNLDGLGNWKTSVYTPVGGSATTDQRNHNYVNEITQRAITGSSPVVFQYDGATRASNGNLKNDGTLIYSYDALNRPIQINRVSDGLIIATYLYDAMNRRARKTVTNGGLTGNIPNGTTDYVWSGWQVIEERNSSNSPIRQYSWGTYIDECIQLTTFVVSGSQNLERGSYYLLQDLLYRAVALTNSTGAIVEAYDTDAYGNTLIFTGPGTDGVWFTDDDVQSNYGANEIIYCGYPDNNRVSTDIGTGLNDPETELYYARNRTYNLIPGMVLRQEPKSRQATGVATRVLQRDPIGLSDGLNSYQYVKDRPQVLIDASGLAAYNISGTNPGKPVLINAGPVVDLGQIKGKCYAYRDWSYRQHVGVFVSAGESNPDIAKIYNLAQWLLTGISKVNPITEVIRAAEGALTIGDAGFAFDVTSYYTKHVLYTYCCGTHYKHVMIVSVKLQHMRLTTQDYTNPGMANNFIPRGASEADKKFSDSLIDVIKEALKVSGGAE